MEKSFEETDYTAENGDIKELHINVAIRSNANLCDAICGKSNLLNFLEELSKNVNSQRAQFSRENMGVETEEVKGRLKEFEIALFLIADQYNTIKKSKNNKVSDTYQNIAYWCGITLDLVPYKATSIAAKSERSGPLSRFQERLSSNAYSRNSMPRRARPPQNVQRIPYEGRIDLSGYDLPVYTRNDYGCYGVIYGGYVQGKRQVWWNLPPDYTLEDFAADIRFLFFTELEKEMAIKGLTTDPISGFSLK